MIQNAKDQVLELTLTAYQTAAAAGLLPADCPVQPSVEIPKDTANGDYTIVIHCDFTILKKYSQIFFLIECISDSLFQFSCAGFSFV